MANIVITGASRGLGLEFVKQLAKYSKTPNIFALCRNPEKAEVVFSFSFFSFYLVLFYLMKKNKIISTFSLSKFSIICNLFYLNNFRQIEICLSVQEKLV